MNHTPSTSTMSASDLTPSPGLLPVDVDGSEPAAATETKSLLWLPYILLTLILLAMAFTSFLHYHINNKGKYGSKTKVEQKPRLSKSVPIKYRVTMSRSGAIRPVEFNILDFASKTGGNYDANHETDGYMDDEDQKSPNYVTVLPVPSHDGVHNHVTSSSHDGVHSHMTSSHDGVHNHVTSSSHDGVHSHMTSSHDGVHSHVTSQHDRVHDHVTVLPTSSRDRVHNHVTATLDDGVQTHVTVLSRPSYDDMFSTTPYNKPHDCLAQASSKPSRSNAQSLRHRAVPASREAYLNEAYDSNCDSDKSLISQRDCRRSQEEFGFHNESFDSTESFSASDPDKGIQTLAIASMQGSSVSPVRSTQSAKPKLEQQRSPDAVYYHSRSYTEPDILIHTAPRDIKSPELHHHNNSSPKTGLPQQSALNNNRKPRGSGKQNTKSSLEEATEIYGVPQL